MWNCILLGKIKQLLVGRRRVDGCIIACVVVCSAVVINEYYRSQYRNAFYKRFSEETGKLMQRRNNPYPLYGKFRVGGENNM